jgi:multicomponent Na+:H+ antiporter subunit E
LSNGRHSNTVGLMVLLGVLVFVWAVWKESYSLGTILEGVVLSGIAILVTNRYLLKARYEQVFRLNPLTALRYVLVLLGEIFKSGVHAMHVTLTGRIDVGVVDLPSNITDPFRGVLVANAITLTPGTVTIDHKQGTFKVIWIECLTTDPEEAAEMIKGSFERVFEPRSAQKRGKREDPEGTKA